MSQDYQDSRRLDTIVRSVSEAVIATDPAGSITLINPAAERLFEVAAADALGRPIALLSRDLGGWLERVREQGLPQSLVFELELRADLNFSATLSPVQGEGDEPIGWVMILRDVTHLKRAEQWKTEAIQSATHDLRNPLNSMQGMLNLLRDISPNLTPEQEQCFHMLQSSLERMSRMVDQVLSLDQVRGLVEPAFSPVELSYIAQRVVQEFRPAAREKNVRLDFDGEMIGGSVLGDEGWLHRAVANLVSNAVKYTPPGGAIRVRYREADGQAICEMTDTGPGIPLAAQSRLFERFYRVPGETSRRTSGTGLGLAIVKAIIERHNGRVWVSSEEGRGSTFGFSLPLIES
ncbi:MAG: ATP-binding protein [Anaerolineales bacterium]|nr:ATP-binding protein [Anaerolineales bacterium]